MPETPLDSSAIGEIAHVRSLEIFAGPLWVTQGSRSATDRWVRDHEIPPELSGLVEGGLAGASAVFTQTLRGAGTSERRLLQDTPLLLTNGSPNPEVGELVAEIDGQTRNTTMQARLGNSLTLLSAAYTGKRYLSPFPAGSEGLQGEFTVSPRESDDWPEVADILSRDDVPVSSVVNLSLTIAPPGPVEAPGKHRVTFGANVGRGRRMFSVVSFPEVNHSSSLQVSVTSLDTQQGVPLPPESPVGNHFSRLRNFASAMQHLTQAPR